MSVVTVLLSYTNVSAKNTGINLFIIYKGTYEVKLLEFLKLPISPLHCSCEDRRPSKILECGEKRFLLDLLRWFYNFRSIFVLFLFRISLTLITPTSLLSYSYWIIINNLYTFEQHTSYLLRQVPPSLSPLYLNSLVHFTPLFYGCHIYILYLYFYIFMRRLWVVIPYSWLFSNPPYLS